MPSIRADDYYYGYRVPGDRIPADAGFAIVPQRLHEMSAEELMRAIKRVLRKSAHTGKYLGLRLSSEPTAALIAADPALLTVGEAYPWLLDHVTQTLQSLRARHSTLVVPL